MNIGIVDYGLGNLASVAAAVEKVGGKVVISSSRATLAQCHRLILPGVGAYRDGMTNLNQRGLVETLDYLVIEKLRPILGICLGFQLLAGGSTEFGDTRGLGWISAQVVRLRPNGLDHRVPHVGWNEFIKRGDEPLFAGVPDGTLFYYVHSYHMVCKDITDVSGFTDCGQKIVAAIRRGNIYGTQFHPEKSQRYGLQVLKNFLSI
jgi:glutamine amidotransferase